MCGTGILGIPQAFKQITRNHAVINHNYIGGPKMSGNLLHHKREQKRKSLSCFVETTSKITK